MNPPRVEQLAVAFVLAAGLAYTAAAAEADASIPLATKHTSVFNKISYRIPKGWVVVDGMSDWLAPSPDKQFWEAGFDPEADAYYVVSAIFPYLTLQDIAPATLHSLTVAAEAKTVGPAQFFSLIGNEAAELLTTMNGSHSRYQIFVRIADDEVATVAGHGPHDQLDAIRALVKAIAATIEPSRKS